MTQLVAAQRAAHVIVIDPETREAASRPIVAWALAGDLVLPVTASGIVWEAAHTSGLVWVYDSVTQTLEETCTGATVRARGRHEAVRRLSGHRRDIRLVA